MKKYPNLDTTWRQHISALANKLKREAKTKEKTK